MDPGIAAQSGDTSGSRAKVSIASQYVCCWNSFNKLLQNLETSNETNETNDKAVAQTLMDEFGRFKVWAGNAGAHRIGKVSLDYRLRESPHVHEELTELLRELSKDLDEGAF